LADCFRLHRFLARYGCPYISKNTRVFECNVCKNLKAIGEELSEIVSGSTASSPDIDGTLCPNFKAIGEELSEF
jgi:hypothetical protein